MKYFQIFFDFIPTIKVILFSVVLNNLLDLFHSLYLSINLYLVYTELTIDKIDQFPSFPVSVSHS